MLLNVKKNEVEVSVLSLVEDVIQKVYGEEEISKLSLDEYAKILATTSMAVLERLVYVENQPTIEIDRCLIESVVKSKTDIK